MKTFLGLDGGGTHSRAIVVREDGRILGEAVAGPSNYHNQGLSSAVEALRRAAAGACLQAGVDLRELHGSFLGCAGVRSNRDKCQLQSAAETAGLGASGELVVENDLANALAGGLAGRPGIALIAGTGSNCLGRDDSGKQVMCGGWGWFLDDVGSAFGLTAAALRVAARSADGRQAPTRLLPSLMAFLGLAEAEELLARLYVDSWTPDQLAEFAPTVIRLAEEGDAAARKLLREGAEALAGLVRGAVQALNFSKAPECVLLGGCARSGPPYQPMIAAAVSAVCPDLRIVEPEFSTTLGAGINALRCGGVDPLPTLHRS